MRVTSDSTDSCSSSSSLRVTCSFRHIRIFEFNSLEGVITRGEIPQDQLVHCASITRKLVLKLRDPACTQSSVFQCALIGPLLLDLYSLQMHPVLVPVLFKGTTKPIRSAEIADHCFYRYIAGFARVRSAMVGRFYCG